MRSEDLIVQLATGLRPIRRVWHPAVSTAAWIVLAAAAIAVVVAFCGFRPNLAHRLSVGFDLPAILAAAGTGVLAGLAAFKVALPDRSIRWTLLPVPAAIAWLATMGWGCLEDLAACRICVSVAVCMRSLR